jgi:cell pole-organizing protein PopZ
MTKENTKSLLENIKKKMMKINTTKAADSQMNFANLDDEFEYIVPKKTDSENSNNQKQNSELDAKTIGQIKAALSNQIELKQDIDEKDLAGNFFAKTEGPKLSDLSLAQDLKADLASANKKSENLAVIKESNVVVSSESKTPNNYDELDLEGLGDSEDEMDFDIETEKKATKDDSLIDSLSTIQKNSVTNNIANNLANVATNNKSDNDANNNNKDHLDLDLDFDLDEDEDDKKLAAAKNSEEDLDLPDLEDLNDDIDLDLKEEQDKNNIVENTEEESFEEISKDIPKDDLASEDSAEDHSNSLDLEQEDKDLDIDDLNLEEDKEDNQYSTKLSENNSMTMNNQDDIKLNLESGQEEFFNHKTNQDSSSEDSLDDLNDDLTFDQKDELSNFNQEEQQDNNQNRQNEMPSEIINQPVKDRLLSKQTIEKTSNSIKNLMNNFNKKPSDKNLDSLHTTTVEQMMMSMLEPKLEEWLNANLPNLVEKIIREEISKIIPKN